MLLFNTHTHSMYSHDSQADVDEICRESIKRNLFGFALTDHLDCEYSSDISVEKNIDGSYRAAVDARKKYRGQIAVFAGVEIGDALFDPGFADRIIRAHAWDVILLSVHAVRYPGFEMPFSVIDFSSWTDEDIARYLTIYFNDLYESVNTFDYDVLSHLTVPLRYIVKKYGKSVDIKQFYPQIEKILKTVIIQDKTLEINTSGCSEEDCFFMPDENILEMYIALGGRKVTVGTDAHTPQRVDNGITQAIKMLNSHGIYTCGYYAKRKYTEFYTGGNHDRTD